MAGNKWDVTINKVEGKPSKFGRGGAHICVPKEWLKKIVVVVRKRYGKSCNRNDLRAQEPLQ